MKQIHRQREQTSGYQWGRAIRGGGVGGTNCWVVSRMDYTTCGILPIFYNNCKWKVTCKNCIKMFNFLIFKNLEVFQVITKTKLALSENIKITTVRKVCKLQGKAMKQMFLLATLTPFQLHIFCLLLISNFMVDKLLL